ncbi:hypothetical protein [Candidatus Phytoplasma pini]|uniref:Uncharacterized protein n=1 Tax=Candidatus Phytoplasma pini TaxID=267362 RepID=A0A559KJX9_9MOLU|nr:hypothetical protein [Candidatus Phytoplasma pini]TVY12398.1 hypothetical protein MDPP_0011 [Candidatus Phytoplasma pini]
MIIIFEKLFLFFKKIFYFESLPKKQQKILKFFWVLFGILLFFLVLSSNLYRGVFNESKINFQNVFDTKVVQEIIQEHNEEETNINLKTMCLVIVGLITILVYKKGVIGISLGTLFGSFLGIWLAFLYPSITYFLELVFRYFLNIS